MTPEQLQAIRERCEKATPGPWFIDEGVNPPDVQIISENLNYAVCETFNCNIDQLNDADPVFIAHARTDISALLDEIEHQRNEVNVWKLAVATASNTIDNLRETLVVAHDSQLSAEREIERLRGVLENVKHPINYLTSIDALEYHSDVCKTVDEAPEGSQ